MAIKAELKTCVTENRVDSLLHISTLDLRFYLHYSVEKMMKQIYRVSKM